MVLQCKAHGVGSFNSQDVLAFIHALWGLQGPVSYTHLDVYKRQAESHLKNYNKLLREQAEELSYELETMISKVAQMSGKPDYIVSNIHRLRLSLEQDIREFKSEAASIKNDVKAFGSQLVLKEFLKGYKIPKAEKDIDFFEGIF